MSLFKRGSDVWELIPTKEDLMVGAKYASISLPWTFNRMGMNTSSRGMQLRAFNIAKGIIGQEVLKRELERRSIKVSLQRKSYRDDDLFDFKIKKDDEVLELDLKTLNHYTNYNNPNKSERKPFNSELIAKFKDYPGPDWRNFFPMPIPHTQISQDKQAYCFAIASSIDFRNDVWTDRPDNKIVAFPFNGYEKFISNKKLCLEREAAEKGIYLNLYYTSDSLFKSPKLKLKILGEWKGKLKEVNIVLDSENLLEEIGPFSNVLCFELNEKDFKKFEKGQLLVGISKNDLDTPVRNSTRQDINVAPAEKLSIKGSDFCNVILPLDYKLHYVGWILKEDFLKNCFKYPGWIWPNDKVNRYENQPWSQITEKDMAMIKKCGFESAVKKKPTRLDAAVLKTSGLGRGSACCYIYPNMHGGGFKETNLYNLPSDLNTMESL